MVTHKVPDGWSRDDARFRLVTDGAETAVAQAAAVAGDGIVGVGAADILQRRVNATENRQDPVGGPSPRPAAVAGSSRLSIEPNVLLDHRCVHDACCGLVADESDHRTAIAARVEHWRQLA